MHFFFSFQWVILVYLVITSQYVHFSLNFPYPFTSFLFSPFSFKVLRCYAVPHLPANNVPAHPCPPVSSSVITNKNNTSYCHLRLCSLILSDISLSFVCVVLFSPRLCLLVCSHTFFFFFCASYVRYIGSAASLAFPFCRSVVAAAVSFGAVVVSVGAAAIVLCAVFIRGQTDRQTEN